MSMKYSTRIKNTRHDEPEPSRSALYFAVEGDQSEIIRFLLQHGATLGILDGHGRTPLQKRKLKERKRWRTSCGSTMSD